MMPARPEGSADRCRDGEIISPGRGGKNLSLSDRRRKSEKIFQFPTIFVAIMENPADKPPGPGRDAHEDPPGHLRLPQRCLNLPGNPRAARA